MEIAQPSQNASLGVPYSQTQMLGATQLFVYIIVTRLSYLVEFANSLVG